MRETIQNTNGKQFHAVSLSGGKDSTAMLLLMIERDMPIDMVLSADTGMEFPEMYEHLAKLDEHLFRERGIHITTLRHPKGFEYLMFDEPKQKPRSLENRAKLGIPPYGYGWPGIRVRWCTGQLKTHLITKEVNRLKGELGAIHYVGIAADEAWRCKDERYPLVEWGITEAQALQACYDRGFDFGGLYEIYHRASCWCCPFQRIDELRKLRKHHPELWEKLLELDRRALAQFGTGPLGQFKQNWSVKRLDRGRSVRSGPFILRLNAPLAPHRTFKTHPTVGAFHLIHGVGSQLPCVNGIGTEVGGDGVAQHIQLHRTLEENAAEPIVVVVQRTLNGCEDGPRDVGRVVLRAEIAHVEPQGLIYEFTAALTVICFQPAIHAADHAGAQPDRSAFLVVIHSSSFLSVASVKIAAKPCKHGTLPDDRLRLFCKTAKPTAVCVSLKSPALRGFVGGLRAPATAAFYLVLLSNG